MWCQVDHWLLPASLPMTCRALPAQLRTTSVSVLLQVVGHVVSGGRPNIPAAASDLPPGPSSTSGEHFAA
jgi:hypothetical protein